MTREEAWAALEAATVDAVNRLVADDPGLTMPEIGRLIRSDPNYERALLAVADAELEAGGE